MVRAWYADEMVRAIEGYIMELFLIVFVYIVYKAMTYDIEKLQDKRFNEYWDEIEKEKNNGQ